MLPKTSIEPCSADEDHVAPPPAVVATDFSVDRLHNNQPAVSADVVVTVNAVSTPVGIVDDAMSMVPSLPPLTIADTTADTATLLKALTGAGTPSIIRSSYGVTRAIASRIASQIDISYTPWLV